MAFKAEYVTNSLLQRGFKEGRNDLTPMKIQKLLFYTHGWHLALTGQPAVDCLFEVWQWGPVLSSVYLELKGYGSKCVTSYIRDPLGKAYVVSPSEVKFVEAMDIAWEKYIGFTATQLSAMTHESGSPWEIAKNAGQEKIPNETIKDYFVRLAHKR